MSVIPLSKRTNTKKTSFLVVPPESAPSTIMDQHESMPFDLLRMNDDCLIGILLHIPMDDLAAIACTSDRLRQIARQVFVLNKDNRRYHVKYQTEAKPSKDTSDSIDDDRNGGKLDYSQFVSLLGQRRPFSGEVRVKQHLAAFGDLINEIDLDYLIDLKRRSTCITNLSPLNDVFRYCNGTLKALKVRDVVWTPQLLMQAQPLLNHLVQFHSIDGKNTELILPELQQCVDLNITGEICAAVFQRDWPQLQQFTFVESNATKYPDDSTTLAEEQQMISSFLKHHRNLRELRLNVPEHLNLNIIGAMHQLEQLHIVVSAQTINMDLTSAFQMNRLKRLTLEGEVDISPLLLRLAESVAIDTLECLRVHIRHPQYPLVPDALSALSRFNKLHTIELDYIGTGKPNLEVTHRFENIPQLRQLTLYNNYWSTYHLSSLPSLETLQLHGLCIDGGLIDALGHLPNLKHLKASYMHFDRDISDAQMHALINVNRLVTLEIGSDKGSNFTKKWLKHMGSTQTMRTLMINNYKIDIGNELAPALLRFTNLQCLEFDHCFTYMSVGGRWDAKGVMQGISGLQHLRELQIDHKTFLNEAFWPLGRLRHLQKLTLIIRNPFNWDNVVDVIFHLTSITMLVLKPFNIIGLTEEIFNDLLEACKWFNRRLVIECHSCEMFNLPSFLFDEDSCQYIEFRQVLQEHVRVDLEKN